MDKNGFLLAEETLKIILAVISIGFLVYFLSALYFANQDTEELEQAKASLDHLIEGINSGSKKVQIYNPEGWALLSWPYKNEGKFPDSCNEKSCICICESAVGTGNFFNNCNNEKKGVCLENIKGLVVNNGDIQSPIWIKNPPIILQINDKTISRE